MPPLLTASSSCKELSIPERAVDKKNSTQVDRQLKRMSDHSRVDDFLKQQVSLKPMPREYKKAKGSCYDMLCSIIYRRGV